MTRLRGRIRRLEKDARKKVRAKGTHVIIVKEGESLEQAEARYRKENPDAKDGDYYLAINIYGTQETETEV